MAGVMSRERFAVRASERGRDRGQLSMERGGGNGRGVVAERRASAEAEERARNGWRRSRRVCARTPTQRGKRGELRRGAASGEEGFSDGGGGEAGTAGGPGSATPRACSLCGLASRAVCLPWARAESAARRGTSEDARHHVRCAWRGSAAGRGSNAELSSPPLARRDPCSVGAA